MSDSIKNTASARLSYTGWRAELLAEMALSRVPDLVVHKPKRDYGYDFIVASSTGVCFFVIVKAISSFKQKLSNPSEAQQIQCRLNKKALDWAKQSRSPVFIFLIDVDTNHSRYLRLDLLDVSSSKSRTPLLRFPRTNILDKKGVESILSEIGAFKDPKTIVTLGLEHRSSETIAKEFEKMINDPAIRERDIQKFLEHNPSVLLTSLGEGQEVFSRVSLETSEGRFIPDFLIKPYQGERWSIVELRDPTLPIVVGRENRRHFSARVHEAIAQVRNYKRYFNLQANRKRVARRYGMEIRKPQAFVVIGRSLDKTSEEELSLLKDCCQDVILLTYDQLHSRFTQRSGIKL